MSSRNVGCLLKRLSGIWEILARVRKKIYNLQRFYFDQNPFGRARANAIIRENDRFVLDFAPQHFEIDAEVAEIGLFACILAPAGTWEQRRVMEAREVGRCMLPDWPKPKYL